MKLPSISPVFLLLCLLTTISPAQTCHFGQGEDGLNADLKDLRAQPTCQSAYAIYKKCLWGSSADGPRADIVITKCKSVFQTKITEAQQRTLRDKLSLCGLEYRDMDGTLWLSEASSCGLQVYVAFATDLTQASRPIPRASFECNRAQTALETAVCNDHQLGRFDLLMDNAYKSFLGEVQGQDKPKLLQLQRAWNASTPAACNLSAAPPSSTTLTCLRKRYHDRMQALNGCAAGADVSCLDTYKAQP